MLTCSFIDLPKLTAKSSSLSNPSLFQNVTSVNGDLNADCKYLLAKHHQFDLFPLTLSKTADIHSGRYFTSITIEATVSEYPETLADLPFLQHITIASDSCKNGTEFIIQNMKRLRSISVGRNCFTQCTARFILTDLPLLKSLKIGSNSFVYVRQVTMMNLSSLSQIKIGTACLQGIPQNSVVVEATLSNFPRLTKLKFGDSSFKYFSTPKLQSFPSLVQLSFGQNCFGGKPSHPMFVVSDFPSLENVKFGKGSFGNYGGCSIQSLPVLQTVTFEKSTFAALNEEDDEDELCHSLVIRSCSMLQSLKLHATCFPNACNFVLEGIIIIIVLCW